MVRVVALFALVAAVPGWAFAQNPKKTPDPERRDKMAVSVQPRKPHSGVSSPGTTSSAPRDLAKIERNSTKSLTPAHKKNPGSSAPAPKIAVEPQPKSKPMKFSYQPPKGAGKTQTTAAPVKPGSPNKAPH